MHNWVLYNFNLYMWSYRVSFQYFSSDRDNFFRAELVPSDGSFTKGTETALLSIYSRYGVIHLSLWRGTHSSKTNMWESCPPQTVKVCNLTVPGASCPCSLLCFPCFFPHLESLAVYLTYLVIFVLQIPVPLPPPEHSSLWSPSLLTV